MAKSRLALVTPATVIGTVAPRPPPQCVHNAEVRAREYLTGTESDRFIKAAGANRNGSPAWHAICVLFGSFLAFLGLKRSRFAASMFDPDSEAGEFKGADQTRTAGARPCQRAPRGAPSIIGRNRGKRH
jgi:hypothetical protein